MAIYDECFNLVIEMLFISGPLGARAMPPCLLMPFQSRNRDAFHFRGTLSEICLAEITVFQSRNRDAFHFRVEVRGRGTVNVDGFNLVIEMLFISGSSCPSLLKIVVSGFNLVIEMLFISGVWSCTPTASASEVSIS